MKDSDSAIVPQYKQRGDPDSIEAWVELECMYGGRAHGKWFVQLLAFERGPRVIQYNSAVKSTEVIVSLDTIWGKFWEFGTSKPKRPRGQPLY